MATLLVACQPADDAASQLLEVAEQGDLASVEALLRRTRTADVRDHCEWTPLMKAASNGHDAIVSRLLAAGAEVDARDSGDYTALLLAAGNNHLAVVKQLLAAGAMIDHQETTQGFTALIWAAQRGHTAMVALLLRQGADRTLPDFSGKQALDHAREHQQQPIIDLLISRPNPV